MFTKEDLQEFLENLLGMIRWLIVAGITGVLVGLVGVLFGKGMTFVNGCRAAHPWIIWLLPVGGVAIIGLYHLFHVYNPRGTNLVLEAIHAKEEVPLYMAPLIIVSTLITHLVGGSAGREGAALQLGGSIGEQLGRWFRFDDKDRGLMVMCGMSAAFSALFGTPLAAAVFPMEVASVGIMHYAALVPCVCASIVASRLALYFGMQPEAFPVLEVPEFTGTTAGAAVLLGILCAIISIVFCVMLHQVGAQFKKFSNPYVKAAVRRRTDSGHHPASWHPGLLQCRHSADRAGAGGRSAAGGLSFENDPDRHYPGLRFQRRRDRAVLLRGRHFWCPGREMLGLSPALYGAAGMAAVFCGVTNCPISTLLISFEMFGFEGMLYYAIAVSISYMLSGYYSLYHDQKIMYSKVKTEFINRKSK